MLNLETSANQLKFTKLSLNVLLKTRNNPKTLQIQRNNNSTNAYFWQNTQVIRKQHKTLIILNKKDPRNWDLQTEQVHLFSLLNKIANFSFCFRLQYFIFFLTKNLDYLHCSSLKLGAQTLLTAEWRRRSWNF